MMNTALKTARKFNPEPVLRSILKDAALEHQKTEEMFRMLGWADLPQELKLEIKDDVKGYIDELEGKYSSICPFIQRRRESVDFWVNSYKDGVCSLGTALDTLRQNVIR